MIKKIVLQKGKEKSVQRFHPWVFSGAILKKEGDIKDGDIVEVYDAFNHFLAMGHYHNSSICVRIFSFHPVVPDYNFWKTKVEKAISYRKAIQILDDPHTNMFRLINGEGDGMPGLIVDWFNGNMVIQFHSIGMYLIKDILVKIFQEFFTDSLQSIYNKSATTLPENKHIQPNDELLYGNFGEVIVKENDIPFYIDIVKGQKTGFFIDQRDNRKMVGAFAKEKKVLNLFCYTGGFSAYALAGKAQLVHSVDISRKAIELTDQNIALLGNRAQQHQSFTDNVFDFLDNMPPNFYDLIVLDPPAFAKHHKVKDQGIKGYRNINRKAMEKIKQGGFLFTFSCSQAISKEDFQTIIFSAAAMENKNVQIVKQLQHAIDHPINIYHPEGSYLKGFVLQIN